MSHLTLHVHYGRLSLDQPDLARAVRGVIGYHGSTWRVTELDEFADRDLAEMLRLWVKDRQRFVPDPAAPPPTPPAPQEPQISFNDAMAEQHRDMKMRADQAAAINRLDEYEKIGLENTDHNFQLFKEFVDKSDVRGYWSAQIVDVAIKYLGQRLTWRKEEPPPQPATPEPTEHLEPWQLPLDADERAMKASTTKALLDLNKRRRQLSGQVYVDNSARFQGGFGSKF